MRIKMELYSQALAKRLTIKRIEELEKMISSKYQYICERKERDILELLLDKLNKKKDQIQKKIQKLSLLKHSLPHKIDK